MENFVSDIGSTVNQTMKEMSESETEITKIEPKTEVETKKINKKRKNRQEKVEKIIQKWLKLQKTIKEEITLEEVIIKQQNDDFAYLKKLFTEYYETKLKSRKEFEIIKKLEKNMKMDEKQYIVEKDSERILLDSNDPIKNLMFILRNNYDYITKLVSLIEETDEFEKVDSLVELFCNQFYDNILIPNPEQEELLILIYKLLEEEITPMNSASIDEFLNDTSFIGKFISSYMNKRELKVFLAMLLNPLILSIENSGLDCMDMSLNNINNEINRKKPKEIPDISLEHLLEKIPKTTIHFKKYYVLENEQEEEENADRTGINNDEGELNRESIASNSSYNRTESIDFNSDIDYNPEYKNDLNIDKIYEKIVNEEKEEIKDLYLYQLEQIGNDPDLFTNAGLKLVLSDSYFKNNKSHILKRYYENFIFIKKKIDYIIQSLIDKISTIPYTVRCICKVISLLMHKKFPDLPKYLRNSFLGKFIFDKCIFPVLSFENKNVMDSRIFSSNTKKCLNVIISVLSNANRCCLYPTTTDTEKTIFNYYLIEIIPILNQFYEKLIDIELPKALEDLVSKVKLKIEQNLDNKIFNFKRKNDKRRFQEKKEEQKKKKEPIKKEDEILFDYFKENDDEIMHLESICFSLSDVLFIIELIKRNTKIFEGLSKYEFFIKTLERIQFDDYKLNEIVRNNVKSKQFFIIFRDEKNSKLEKLLRSNKKNISTFISGNQDSDLICKRIKFCIKTILKGLNLLNNKDYSYLNKAVSTNKFFSAIKHTLNDLSEYSEEHDKIPLKWYGQYINNYKKGLAEVYQKDDFEKLYSELYDEEKDILSELKSFSSTIITRDGMNLRCAEKLLDKAKYDLSDIEEAKKFVKIEKFIDTEKIEVCIRIKDDKDIEREKNVPDKDKLPTIIVTDASECNIHQKNAADENDKRNKPSSHATYIKDFIYKFSENPWNSDKNNKNQKPKTFVIKDIENGDRKYKVYKTMKMYMDIVKKKIKDPIINVGLFNDNVNVNEIAEKIEDHILRQMYKDVFPNRLDKDDSFYTRTKCLEWVTPEQLEIKKVYFNQLGFAISCIRKIDEARSVLDKINLIINAHTSINNTIKFSSGKDDDSGQDEMTPIFQYIILKAHPRRMISNINYIKCFLGDNLSDSKGFLLSQIESATSYINNINYEQLKIPKEEFERRYNDANRKFNIKFRKLS